MKSLDPLDAAYEAVNDSRSLLAFAQLLLDDRIDEMRKDAESPPPPYCPGANGWENATLEAFLDAGIAWAEATDFGRSQGLDHANPWQRFADFLLAGKEYE